MKKEYQLTKEGVDALHTEIAGLKSMRVDVAEKIKTAREFGDLSENTEYHNAMDEYQKTEARIFEIEHILKNVEIIVAPKNKTEVEIGNTVTISAPSADKTFKIVGSVEANPSENKISNESPIGLAIMGKKVGDTVEVGSTTYKISAIA